ncbi:interleukin-12 subunit alpha [Paramormyrops kingsleyae]|uniref:interleukin-12 subunit alpha n=1 Tax=Paramormyrops kingsleyae TaxID=1676925 RepID=UPI000CD656DF|nr:interleukin-12 subunit alpha isoform X2 [Paramormyrops kingsleyae]
MLSYANFRITSWLVLVAVSSHLCRSGFGNPLRHSDDCLTYSTALLRNITAAVEELGFYCSKLSVEMNNRNLSVCEPKNSSCANRQTSGFNEDACFRAIREDLQYYKNMLPKIQNDRLRATLMGAIEDLVKNCAFPHVLENPASSKAAQAPSFEDRVHLCKVLRGFHVRAITLNRVISYVAAGDHLK